MSFLLSILQFVKLIISGYTVYKDPNNENTEFFNRTVSEIFADDYNTQNNYTSWGSSNFEESKEYYSHDFNESQDIPVSEDDNDDVLCKVCFSNKKNIVIIPCSHSSTCIKCINIISKNDNKCPTCRGEIVSKVFFFSS